MESIDNRQKKRSRSLHIFGVILCSLLGCSGGGTSSPPSMPISAPIANHHVRADAFGANDGTNWADAYTALPTSLVRGDTYYIASGSYGDYDFDDEVNGTLVITLKKATVTDHGTLIGWQDSYGTGQASFASLAFMTDYYAIDGQTRNENDWSLGSAYGFHAGSVIASRLHFDGGLASSHVTIRYIDVGGSDGAMCRYVPNNFCDSGVTEVSFYLGGFRTAITDWTISHFRSHNVQLPFQMPGVSNILIEYGWIGPNWSKEAIRGGNGSDTTNTIIRYNKFVDSCKGLPIDSTADHCTAQIAIWDTDRPNGLDNNAIYGNLFYDTSNYPGDPPGGVIHTDACINIGGNGGRWRGVSTNNSKIYNNTIVGVTAGVCTIGFADRGTNNEAFNNLWYAVTALTECDEIVGACINNTLISTGNQFVNAVTAYPGTGFNYHLASATVAGTRLPAPYNHDMDGMMRGTDGVWDLGAFEFRTAERTP
jgi:hypothetical protein